MQKQGAGPIIFLAQQPPLGQTWGLIGLPADSQKYGNFNVTINVVEKCVVFSSHVMSRWPISPYWS